MQTPSFFLPKGVSKILKEKKTRRGVKGASRYAEVLLTYADVCQRRSSFPFLVVLVVVGRGGGA